MTFSLCPRCRTNNFESKWDHCHSCQYSIDSQDSTLPIPAWVTEHLKFQPWELREIREMNVGLKPIRIPIGDAREKRGVTMVAELPQRRKPYWGHSRQDFFPIIENGVVEI